MYIILHINESERECMRNMYLLNLARSLRVEIDYGYLQSKPVILVEADNCDSDDLKELLRRWAKSNVQSISLSQELDSFISYEDIGLDDELEEEEEGFRW